MNWSYEYHLLWMLLNGIQLLTLVIIQFDQNVGSHYFLIMMSFRCVVRVVFLVLVS